MRTLRLAAALVAALPAAGVAQSVVTRTPNLSGGWTAARGVVQFNFLHRFSVSGPPVRKVTNTPTFTVGTGILDWVMAGFVYGSNSVLVPSYPNEWEFFARATPLAQDRGGPFTLSLQGGYNVASESADGELQLARSVGPLRLLAAGRAFSDGYDASERRYAVAGGAALRLTSSVSLAGDYGVLLDRDSSESATWGAGLQLAVPYTPHSFSIHVSNVGTASLEGASRGTRTRVGFEYTIPMTIRRYAPRRARDREDRPMLTAMAAAEDTVHVAISGLKYAQEQIAIAPGTVVVWTNRDPVQHSVTADDKSFDSDLIEPGASFSRTFADPGRYSYHCTPHPFMRARIIVRAPTEDRHEE